MTTKMVDITPTWREVLPVLVTLLASPKSHPVAMAELKRMAHLADKHLAQLKLEDENV